MKRTAKKFNKSKANTTNPKDLFGRKKVSLSLIPAIATAHCAHAFMNGAKKYGPYNWRDKEVLATIYVDAAKRHLDLWLEGERKADDSGVHHLGHAQACCAILLDAEAFGNLVDDRPPSSAAALKNIYAEISSAQTSVDIDEQLQWKTDQCKP